MDTARPLIRRRLTAWLSSLLLVGTLLPTIASPVGAAEPTLFFSEYVEGSGFNKALEIHNPTPFPVSLGASDVIVETYFNGSTTAAVPPIALTGTIAAGDVFVLAHEDASETILAQADQTTSVSWFNGDDAIVLLQNFTVIDSIGQVGVDPGSEWGTGLTSTQDNTLRRKAGIVSGDTTVSDAFDPATEWDGFAVDTFNGLGSHGGTPPQ